MQQLRRLLLTLGNAENYSPMTTRRIARALGLQDWYLMYDAAPRNHFDAYRVEPGFWRFELGRWTLELTFARPALLPAPRT